jgi:hypothetical protein
MTTNPTTICYGPDTTPGFRATRAKIRRHRAAAVASIKRRAAMTRRTRRYFTSGCPLCGGTVMETGYALATREVEVTTTEGRTTIEAPDPWESSFYVASAGYMCVSCDTTWPNALALPDTEGPLELPPNE